MSFHFSLHRHYDVKRCVKIMSGIITMIYCYMNHSYDVNWCVKIMSRIIT